MKAHFAQGRLASIDALRGVAALAVVLFHATMADAYQRGFVGQAHTPSWLGRFMAVVLSYGYLGVFLFFVISGFCIHLRWAKQAASGEKPRVDFIAFWKRRVQRLYPPYLIAMVIYLGLLRLAGRLPSGHFLAWDLALHLVMLHNLDIHTTYSINGVFWTLAIEEQLYLAYFLLLILRIRFGWARTLVLCLLARAAWFASAFCIHRLWGREFPATEGAASQWFVWALGAMSVESALGIIRLPPWTRSAWVASGILLFTVCTSYIDRHLSPYGLWHHIFWIAVDPMWGLGFFVLINCLVVREKKWLQIGRLPAVVALFARLGIFSYSLYLTHELLTSELSRQLMLWFGWSQDTRSLVSLAVLSPLSIGLAWLFYRLFERPFIPSSTRVTPPPGAVMQPVAFR